MKNVGSSWAGFIVQENSYNSSIFLPYSCVCLKTKRESASNQFGDSQVVVRQEKSGWTIDGHWRWTFDILLCKEREWEKGIYVMMEKITIKEWSKQKQILYISFDKKMTKEKEVQLYLSINEIRPYL